MPVSVRLFGIETEYGIARDDLEQMDPVVESMELVRAHLTASFERRWDYAGRIRMRMRADFACRDCNRTGKRTSSQRSTPIGRFPFMR